MTTPTDDDREAAEKYLATPYDGPDELIQAFAAHRLLGQRQGIEMAAKVVEAGMHNEYGRPQLVLLAAIRNLATEAEQ